MNLSIHVRRNRPLFTTIGALGASLLVVAGCADWRATTDAKHAGSGSGSGGGAQGTPGAPYANMPAIAPIGVRIGKYMEVPESAKGPTVDAAKGYRIQELGGKGSGLYMVTDNAIQSMFLVYDNGVVVLDAPQAYATHIRQAIDEVTNKPITHLIYSHSHADHIGAARGLLAGPGVASNVVIIAQEETKRLLARADDPERPLPTVTFADKYTLKVGSQTLELSYHGNAHEPGNIFIYAPAQRTLMVIDVVFPGWMPWRRFAIAQDVEGYFAQVEEINKLDFDTFVGGHVMRSGTKADVELQLEFMKDLKATVANALKTTKLGEEMDAEDRANPWALFDNYIDRVVIKSVNELTPRWSKRLGGFDVYIWDQCYSMEQSLRIE
jgi:glyoxylase-like metal-dependent hydrolase (beta-lactamase superfamily II)